MSGKLSTITLSCLTAALVLLSSISSSAGGGDNTAITFKAALKAARERNEDFMISKEQLKQTMLMRDKAWAAFLPVITMSGGLTHSDKEIVFNDRVILKQDALAGKATATLTFFQGSSILGLLEAYELSKAGVESTRYGMNELSFEVARAYYAVLAAENLVAAAERSVQTAEEHFQAVQIRIEAEEALAIDETRAKMELVSARGALTNSRNAMENTHDYLAFLLNMEPPLELQPPPPLAVPQKSEDELTKHALEHRPDLKAFQYGVKAAKKAATGSWMDFLPSLGLTGTFNATENTGFSGDPYSWNLVLFFEWILWDGGYNRVSIIENKSKLNEAKLEKDKLERNVKIEVKQARRDLDNAEANVATAKEQLKLAGLSREMVLSRYNVGLATSLELTEADDQLRQAEVQMVAQELGYALCVLDMLRVVGLDPQGKEIPDP